MLRTPCVEETLLTANDVVFYAESALRAVRGFWSALGAKTTKIPRFVRDHVIHRNLEQRRSTCVFSRLLSRNFLVCYVVQEA